MKILKNKYFLIICCVVIISSYIGYGCSGIDHSDKGEEKISLPAPDNDKDSIQNNAVVTNAPDTTTIEKAFVKTKAAKRDNKKIFSKKIIENDPPVVSDNSYITSEISENKELPNKVVATQPVVLQDTIHVILQENETSPEETKTDNSIIPRKNRKPVKVLGLKIPTQPKQRIDREIRNYLFIPKGQSLGGITVSYYKESTDNYDFLILKDWKGNAITYSISPFFGYFYKDNLAVGGRFSYKNTTINIDELNISLNDDLNFNIDGYQYKVESYSATAFHRSYLGLGKSKRFGLFNETNLTYQWGKGTMINHATSEELDGTSQKTKEFQLSINPGFSVFITNNIAVETSIGVAGLKYREIKQQINHVDFGRHKTASADFSLNIFKINLGITVCL